MNEVKIIIVDRDSLNLVSAILEHQLNLLKIYSVDYLNLPIHERIVQNLKMILLNQMLFTNFLQYKQ